MHHGIYSIDNLYVLNVAYLPPVLINVITYLPGVVGNPAFFLSLLFIVIIEVAALFYDTTKMPLLSTGYDLLTAISFRMPLWSQIVPQSTNLIYRSIISNTVYSITSTFIKIFMSFISNNLTSP